MSFNQKPTTIRTKLKAIRVMLKNVYLVDSCYCVAVLFVDICFIFVDLLFGFMSLYALYFVFSCSGFFQFLFGFVDTFLSFYYCCQLPFRLKTFRTTKTHTCPEHIHSNKQKFSFWPIYSIMVSQCLRLNMYAFSRSVLLLLLHVVWGVCCVVNVRTHNLRYRKTMSTVCQFCWISFYFSAFFSTMLNIYEKKALHSHIIRVHFILSRAHVSF